MKFSIPFLFVFFMFAANAFAQPPETFDIATFQPPKGWERKAGPDGVQFSTENKTTGAICLITLFRSVPSVGGSKENFDAAWQTLVKAAVNVLSEPQMQPSFNPEDWKAEMGSAPFEKDGVKGAVVLVTVSGHGKMVNLMILTNTQAYEQTVTAFIESIRLKKPEVENQPQPVAGPTVSHPSLAGNFWKMGSIRGGMLGHSNLSTATFSKTYHFFSNGTYKFSREDMQLAAPKYYLEHEEGTYTVTGNTITLTPRKATFSQHRLNKEEPPLKAGNIPLSTAQYNFEFWNYDGNWRLLLSPVDGNETKRDGTFSFYRNGEAQRTYQYHLVNAKGELMR